MSLIALPQRRSGSHDARRAEPLQVLTLADSLLLEGLFLSLEGFFLDDPWLVDWLVLST